LQPESKYEAIRIVGLYNAVSSIRIRKSGRCFQRWLMTPWKVSLMVICFRSCI